MGQDVANTALAEWLHDRLEERGWGVRTLARHMTPDDAERSRRAVNRYLHEGSFPSPENRRLIAIALNVDENELPPRPMLPFERRRPDVTETNDLVAALREALDKVSPANKELEAQRS
jgi:transcriptional regulator with XRE-family HTH domain